MNAAQAPDIDKGAYSHIANGIVTVSGFVTDYQPHEIAGGPKEGGWVEVITRSALEDDLRNAAQQGRKIMLRLNLSGLPISSTTAGTLHLTCMNEGLHAVAVFREADYPLLAGYLCAYPGDMQWGFSFNTPGAANIWDGNCDNRTITALQIFDIGLSPSPCREKRP